MEGALVVRIVETELGRRLQDLFVEFDAVPLGSASVAQVHRARLRANGAEVAVKVQRPSMEQLMLGDVANLKSLALRVRGRLPVDYYVVFSELEQGLQREFDATIEAKSMTRVADLLASMPGGPPLRVPRPVKGLVSRRVLVMDYIAGTPLSRLAAEPPAATAAAQLAQQLMGRKLLRALTDAYAVMMLQDGVPAQHRRAASPSRRDDAALTRLLLGFIHGDPHPGNLMIQPDGGALRLPERIPLWMLMRSSPQRRHALPEIALIDFGQTKQLDADLRKRLATIVLQLADCRAASAASSGAKCDYGALADSAIGLGVDFKPDCPDIQSAAAALAMWLFDSTGATSLPGGYASNELSSNSPVAQVAAFPQSLVFVGRATVLIRGLANRLGIDWSLAREWTPAARALLAPPVVAAPLGIVGRLHRLVLGMRRWALAALARFVAAILRLRWGSVGGAVA
jgi:aarF domain-containing kinase